MAYFAKLDDKNNVIDIHTVSNAELLDENGIEIPQKGIDFLNQWQGFNSKWIQASYNGRIRKHYPGIGWSYSETLDAFIPPKPFNSWVLNENTCLWEAPVPIPEPIDGFIWVWNESTVSWQSIKGMEI